MVNIDKVEIESALWVATFAYFGVATRILLFDMASSAQSSLISTIGASFFLPNILGTFALGLSTGSQSLITTSWQPKVKGFNTGFCGSLTTFSTWQLVVGLEVISGRWLDAVAESALVFATSYLALLGGLQLGNFLAVKFARDDGKETLITSSAFVTVSENEKHGTKTTATTTNGTAQPTSIRGQITRSSWWYWPVSVTALVTISVWLLFAVVKSRQILFLAMAFGPFGALLRHLLSFGNRKTPNFPVFTLIANELACAVNIMIVIAFNIIQPSASESTINTFHLWVRSGISAGGMGSLSTVSTWINELHKLSTTKSLSYAYRYGILSVVIAQIIIIGSGIAYVIISQKSLIV